LGDFQPSHSYTFGGIKPFIDFLHFEHVMSFLMGLNDNFSQISAQILLMDLILSISCVFPLVVQQEKRQEVGFLTQQSSQITFVIPQPHNKPQQSGSIKKERPCNYCKMLVHHENKCYKKHEYQVGYKKIQLCCPLFL